MLSHEKLTELINSAMRGNYKLHIIYRNINGGKTERDIQPLGWIADYKIKAFCYLRRAEREFVLSGILDISKSDTAHLNTSPSIITLLSSFEELKATEPQVVPALKPKQKQPILQTVAGATFSEVTNSEQWSALIRYYWDCLYQEYLLNYIIKDLNDYQFVQETDDNKTVQVLAGRGSFRWERTNKNQQTGIAKFITDESRKQQRLCIAYRTLYIAPKQIIPLIFAECDHEIQDDKLILTVVDNHELNYALLDKFDLDRHFFDEILSYYASEDAESAIPHIREAIISKLEEAIKHTIPIYDKPLSEQSPQMVLLTNPYLFWASNNVTYNLLKELEALSDIAYEHIPSSIKRLLNLLGEFNYPQPVSLDKDERFYVTPMNTEQRQACESALTSPITVITGPPGTGKSQLILNIIANAVVRGQTVLFASRNNEAVDVVTKRAKREIVPFRAMIRTGNRLYKDQAPIDMSGVLDHLYSHQINQKSWWYQEAYQQERVKLKTATDRVEEIYLWEKKLAELAEISLDIVKLDFQQMASKKHLDEIRHAIKNVNNLETDFKYLQHDVKRIENILHEEIRQNRNGYTIINAIQAIDGFHFLFDTDFSDILSLQNYIYLWLRLIEACEKRKSYESLADPVKRLEVDIAIRIEKLAHDFKPLVDNRLITEDELLQFQVQVQSLSQAIHRSKKRTWSNWFGFRRHQQNQAILLGLNDLLSQLIQPPFEDKVTVKKLGKRLNEVRHFCVVMGEVYKLDKLKQQLNRLKDELDSITNSFSDETRRSFQFVDMQLVQSDYVRLRQRLDDNYQKLDQSRCNCEEFTQPLEDIIFSVINIPHINWNWGYDIERLSRFLNQWGFILLKMGIESEGGKSVALDKVNMAWKIITEKAIGVIESYWVERSNSILNDPVSNQQIRNQIYQLTENQNFYKVFPIWATTNLSMGQIPLYPQLFDLVVIDEASQCDIPSALPLLYRAKRVVIIGDDKQLTHITTLPPEKDEDLANLRGIGKRYWYTEKSLFGLARECVTSRPGVIDLLQHYRSHKDIIQFSNQTFYRNTLDIRTDLAKRKIPNNIPASSGIFWVNVTGKTQHPPSGSAFNEEEIWVIQNLLSGLDQSLKHIEWGYDSIGVVTPYREQKDRLLKTNDRLTDVKIGTAHTFQGNEREIMLFSTVLSSGISEGSLSWLRNTPDLLNVAVTRARTMLIVVGDFEYCRQLDSEHTYQKFAEYVGQSRVLSDWGKLPLLQI